VKVRFSHKAMQAALLVTLYQAEPVLDQAARLLKALVDVDELLTVRGPHRAFHHRAVARGATTSLRFFIGDRFVFIHPIASTAPSALSHIFPARTIFSCCR
jgi:hypothetical protein